MKRLLIVFMSVSLIAFISCSDSSTGPGDGDNGDENGGETTTYTVDVSSTDGGSVSPSGSNEYDEGEEVELEASSNEEYVFSGWTGDMESSDNPLSLTVDQDYQVTANFEVKNYSLTINTEGEGEVAERVVQQNKDYESGTVVELTANPDEGYAFSEWTGDLSGSGNPHQITMDGAKEVTAIFEEQPPPSISSVTPLEGTVGTVVKIEGSNFSYTDRDNKVTFNGVETVVEDGYADSVFAKVPEGATDGPIEVTVNGQTATGPDFNVLPAPTINSVSPEEGQVGTEVTITGTNFRPTASKNVVKFGEVEAPVKSATSTEIITEVPEGAGDDISVKIYQQTASIDFTVLQLGKLEVTTSTTGSEQDFNGYVLTIEQQNVWEGVQKDVKVGLNTTKVVEELEVGTYEIGLTVGSVASNCTRNVNGYSTIEIQKGEVTTHDFDVTCEATNAPLEQGKLVFESANDGNIQISNVDGTAIDEITTHDDYFDENPAVSPDGESIAFTSDDRGSEGYGLYIMDITGENIHKIADGERFYYSWSPDGNELVILEAGKVSIINRDGSNERSIAENATAVDWSPNGDEIAIADKANSGDIKFVSPNGSELRSFNIQDFSGFNDLEYSPDGTELIVTGDLGDDKSGLYFVNTDGSNVRHVFSSNYARYHDPSWSPDGSKFAFQEATHTPTYDSALKIADIASGDLTQPFHPTDHSDPFWIESLE